MEFKISKKEFLKGLQRIQGIVDKRNTIPILSNILLETENDGINMIATDLEVGIKGFYKAEIISEGKITLSAKKTFEIIRELPEEDINVKEEENNLIKIKCGRSNFKIVSLPKDDFPSLPECVESTNLKYESALIKDMINKTIFAISHDETRYVLNGVLFELIPISTEDQLSMTKMVATDGHRLTLVEKKGNWKCEEEKKVIIPQKALIELRKIVDEKNGENIYIDFRENHIIFRKGKLFLISRLIEGQFPDYNQVIPKRGNKELVINKNALLHTLRRISTISSDISKTVKFNIEKDKINVSSNNPELGEANEDLEIEYQGEPISLGINAKYVMDVLNVIEDEQIRLILNEAVNPCVINKVNSEDYLCVIMPIRI